MREIILTQGYVTIVDDEDYELYGKYNWHVRTQGKSKLVYAVRNVRNKLTKKNDCYYLHRLIIKVSDEFYVDHINGNGLDNRRENLRVCTQRQNSHNQRKLFSYTSSYKGVSWEKNCKKWRVRIRVNGRLLCRGLFSDELEAAHIYNESALKYFGPFARCNYIQ